MKATPDIQKLLLNVAELDLAISRSEQDVQNILKGEKLSVLRDELASVNEKFLGLRNQEENFAKEIEKVATDLASVEKRIDHDRKLVNTSSSAKDIDGIEHEIRSLKVRKSDLEDLELSLMGSLEQAQVDRAEVEAIKVSLASQIAELESSVEALLVKAKSALALSVQERASKLAALPEDLANRYLKLASRSVGAAALVGRECGACRIALTAAAYDEVVATPVDEIPSCPNCQALLVR